MSLVSEDSSKLPLENNKDYALDSEQSKLTLASEYLAQVPPGDNRFELVFTLGQTQVIIVAVEKLTPLDPEQPSTPNPDQPAPADPEQPVSADAEQSGANNPEKDPANGDKQDPLTGSDVAARSTGSDGRIRSVTTTFFPEDLQYFNPLTYEGRTGTLDLSVDLTGGGTNRILVIDTPDYGFGLLSPYPTIDGKITSVSVTSLSSTKQRMTLTLADTLDQVLNMQVRIQPLKISEKSQIATWCTTGTLPATGFDISLHSNTTTLLDSATYGSFVPENIAGDESKFDVNNLPSNWRWPVYDTNKRSATVEGSYYIPKMYSSGGTQKLVYLDKIKIYVPSHDWYTYSARNNVVTLGRGTDSGGSYIEWPVGKYNVESALSGEIEVYVSLKGPGAPSDTLLSVQPSKMICLGYGPADTPDFSQINPGYKTCKVSYRDNMTINYEVYNFPDNEITEYNEVQIGMNNQAVRTMGQISNHALSSTQTDEYLNVNPGENVSVTLSFPYEIQPRKFIKGDDDSAPPDRVTYTTFLGTTQTVEGKNNTLEFDYILAEGDRVTEVKAMWDTFSAPRGTLKYTRWTLGEFNVPAKYSDGTSVSSKSVLIDVNVSCENIAFSANKQQRLFLRDKMCRDIAVKEVRENVSRINFLAGLNRPAFSSYSYFELAAQNVAQAKDEVEDLELTLAGANSVRVSDGASSYSAEESLGMLYSGKVEASWLLSGFTINYETELLGPQSYVIPAIPENESLQIDLCNEGDRFKNNVTLSKPKTTSWPNNTTAIELIKFDIAPKQEFSNGVRACSLPTKVQQRGNTRALTTYIVKNSDCVETDSVHVGGKTTSLESLIYYYNSYGIKSLGATAVGQPLFQGSTGVFEVGLTGRTTVGGQGTLFSQIPFSAPLEVYVELKNPEVIFGEGIIGSRYPDNISGDPFSPKLKSYPWEYMFLDDGSTWLKIAAPEINYINGHTWNEKINNYFFFEMYALTGARLGVQPIFGDIYIDMHVQEVHDRYDGSATAIDFKGRPFSFVRLEGNFVPDDRGLLKDGDTTTSRLLKTSSSEGEVLQRAFEGLSLAPKAGEGYKPGVTNLTFYPHQQEDLGLLVSAGGSTDALSDYEVTLEIPRAGKGGSQYDISLTGAPRIQSNSSGSTPLWSYRLTGGSSFVEAGAISDWSQVDAVKMYLPTMGPDKVLNFMLDMQAPEKHDTTVLSALLFSDYSYKKQGGEEVTRKGGDITFNYAPYTLSGYVWRDVNENGAKSGTGEDWFSNIPVNLVDSDGAAVLSTTTNSSGAFSFTTEHYEGLRIVADLPEGYKYTKQASVESGAAYTDSDFDRTAEEFVLPAKLTKSTYANISAGLVKLPVVTAPDLALQTDSTLPAQASVASDMPANQKPSIHFDQALDTSIASVDATTGAVTSSTNSGTTTAKAWVENTLGDTAEATYSIVVSDLFDLSLTKTLVEPATQDEIFTFKIERRATETDTDVLEYYHSVSVLKGQTTATSILSGLPVGHYTITELDTNWRYDIDDTSSKVQTQTITAAGQTYDFAFTNKVARPEWISGHSSVVNHMRELP